MGAVTIRRTVCNTRSRSQPMVYPESAIKRLFAKLREGDMPPSETGLTTRCIEFQGCLNSRGYGMLNIGGKARYTHRVMKEVMERRILEKHEVVMHLCDNRICCNPDHLKIGNVLENNLDAFSKDRHPRSRLRPFEVAVIKMHLKMGRGITSIAAEYGRSWHCIKAIQQGYTWKNIKPAEHKKADYTPKPRTYWKSQRASEDPFADSTTEFSVELGIITTGNGNGRGVSKEIDAHLRAN